MRAADKILDRDRALAWRASLKDRRQRLVFTNGCFDLLHPGHTALLETARSFGDALLVGINTDDSVRRNKGPERPLLPAAERAEVVAALRAVDAVTLFDEDTPLELITALVPDALVKGDDWALDAIVGREVVERAGGRVERVTLLPGFSTTRILRAVRSGSGPLGVA